MKIKLEYSDIQESLLLLDKDKINNHSDLKKINLMIDATNKCQLGCTYCYFGEKSCSVMDTDKLFIAVKNVIYAIGPQLEVVGIHYMGGEPLLGWKRILELNKKIKNFCEEKGIKFGWSLTSNLIALTEKKKEVMIREKAGIHCSVDGPEFIQNTNRPFRNGKGSFNIVDKNIDLALQISPKDTARVTITPESSHHMEKITHYLFDKGFEVIGIYPAYNLDWKQKDIEAWTKGIVKSFDIAIERKKKISTIVHPNSKEKPEFEYCGAGKGLWALNVNGVLYNCHRLTNQPENAIIDASISEIDAIKKAMITRSLAPRTIKAPNKCLECSALNFCSGGCWADNLCANGNSYQPEALACTFRQITLEAIKNYLGLNTISIKDWQCMLFVICCLIACDGCEGGGCQSCESGCQSGCDNCDRMCYGYTDY